MYQYIYMKLLTFCEKWIDDYTDSLVIQCLMFAGELSLLMLNTTFSHSCADKDFIAFRTHHFKNVWSESWKNTNTNELIIIQ